VRDIIPRLSNSTAYLKGAPIISNNVPTPVETKLKNLSPGRAALYATSFSTLVIGFGSDSLLPLIGMQHHFQVF
jgi:hypothetical protein